MASDDGYSDDDFVKEDEDGDDSEQEAELEAQVSQKYLTFKQEQEERQAKLRETRPWTTPPLESPNPEVQKERKTESATLGTPEAAAAVTAPRAEYEPPPPGPNRPSYAGKPNLDDIQEDDEGAGVKRSTDGPSDKAGGKLGGTSGSESGDGEDEGGDGGQGATITSTSSPGPPVVPQTADGAEGTVTAGATDGQGGTGDAWKPPVVVPPLANGQDTPGMDKKKGGEGGAGGAVGGATGAGDGGGSDGGANDDGVEGEEQEEEEEEEEEDGEGAGQAKGPVVGDGAGPDADAGNGAGDKFTTGRWVVGDTSSDSIAALQQAAKAQHTKTLSVPLVVPVTGQDVAVAVTTGPTDGVVGAAGLPTVPAAASTAPGTVPPLASLDQVATAAQLEASKPSAVVPPAAPVSVPTTLPPPSSHALVGEDSEVSIAEDDGESLDEEPLLHKDFGRERERMRVNARAEAAERAREKEQQEQEWDAGLPPKPLGASLPQGASPSRTAPWLAKPGRYDGVAASDGGSAWGAESAADDEPSREEGRETAAPTPTAAVKKIEEPEEEEEALMDPHDFALKLLMHDLRTLPAHRKAVAAAEPPSSRRPASAKPKSRYHDAAVTSVNAMLSSKAAGGAPPRGSRPASAPTARTSSAAAAPDAAPSPSAKPSLRVSSAVPYSRGPPSTTSSAGWSSTGNKEGAMQMSRIMRAKPDKRDQLAETAAAQDGQWDNASEDQGDVAGGAWASPSGGTRQRPASARPMQGTRGSRPASGIPPRPRPFSAQSPTHDTPQKPLWEAGGRGWQDAGGLPAGGRAPFPAPSPAKSGIVPATGIYTADAQKQIASANRSLVALGSRLRYQLRDPNDPTRYQVVRREFGLDAGDESVSVVKELSAVEFMTALRQLKDRVRQQQAGGIARPPVRLDAYGSGAAEADAYESPIKTLWEEPEAGQGEDGDGNGAAVEPSGLIYRHADPDPDYWLMGLEGYDGMGPDAAMPPPLHEGPEAEAVAQPSAAAAAQMQVAGAAQRCQELALRVSMLRQAGRRAAH